MKLLRGIKKLPQWLHQIWNDIEWPLIGILILATTYMGTHGFALYFQAQEIKFTTGDCLYSTIQLFSLESGNISPGDTLPTSLQIARFVAPLLAAYTIFQALKELFGKQVLLFNLWKIRNPYIVAGLGNKGLRLVTDLRKAGQPTVIIEMDENNPHLEACRDMGALVLIGDARDKNILKRAGVNKTSHLISVCGDDGTNTEVAVSAKSLATKDVTCAIHITDPYLWGILKEQEFMVQDSRLHFRLELFNIYDSGARYLLRKTLFEKIEEERETVLLIVGMGMLAEYLILHAAQFWAYRQSIINKKNEGLPVAKKLFIHVVDILAEEKTSRLQIRYPLIKETCQFVLHNQSVDALHTNETEALQNVSHAYICLDDTFLGLQAGFSLLEWAGKKNVQIMVRMTEDAGLASLLKSSQQLKLSPLEAFGLLDETCKISLFDDGTHENLARAIHEHYLQEELDKTKQRLESTPSFQPWESLSEDLKLSNLHQAEHIGMKLAVIGCGLKPWVKGNALSFKIRNDEIEIMAKLEHERWKKEKESKGWQQGKRDNENKYHPDLVAWDTLSEVTKEKNRQAVRQIPILLARAGFQIYRIPQKITP